jgi:hypothetical protein
LHRKRVEVLDSLTHEAVNVLAPFMYVGQSPLSSHGKVHLFDVVRTVPQTPPCAHGIDALQLPLKPRTAAQVVTVSAMVHSEAVCPDRVIRSVERRE